MRKKKANHQTGREKNTEIAQEHFSYRHDGDEGTLSTEGEKSTKRGIEMNQAGKTNHQYHRVLHCSRVLFLLHNMIFCSFRLCSSLLFDLLFCPFLSFLFLVYCYLIFISFSTTTNLWLKNGLCAIIKHALPRSK